MDFLDKVNNNKATLSEWNGMTKEQRDYIMKKISPDLLKMKAHYGFIKRYKEEKKKRNYKKAMICLEILLRDFIDLDRFETWLYSNEVLNMMVRKVVDDEEKRQDKGHCRDYALTKDDVF